MPDEYRISELDTASTLNNSDLLELSQVSAGATSGYVSKKTLISDLAEKINNNIEFTTALNTTDKKIIGAINEVDGKTDDLQYHIGDTLSLATPFVGYVSSSSKHVRFTIPLDKPLGNDITGINFASVGDISLYGGSGSDTITPTISNFTFSLNRGSLYIQYEHPTAVNLANSTGCTVFFSSSGTKITFT